MKKQLKISYSLLMITVLMIAGATSCNKDLAKSSSGSNSTSSITTSTSSVIAVATTSTSATTDGTTTTTDSVYVMQTCDKGTHRDSIAASALPATIDTYLTTNYSGYTFIKAYAVNDTTGTVKGYVVIINYNGKPVGLLFAADGTFVKVLEQREKPDLNNNGWHPGGRFCNRDSLFKDSVALSALPSAITAYFTTNHSNDTLLYAFRTADSGYVVISKETTVYANVFTSAGVFVKRIPLPAPQNTILANVTQANLPAAILSYLTTTYPDYVFHKAVSVTVKGVLLGYLVIIDANNTKYAVGFDASGNFEAVKVIW